MIYSQLQSKKAKHSMCEQKQTHHTEMRIQEDHIVQYNKKLKNTTLLNRNLRIHWEKLQESNPKRFILPCRRQKQESYKRKIKLGLKCVCNSLLFSSKALFKGLFSSWISDLDSIPNIVLQFCFLLCHKLSYRYLISNFVPKFHFCLSSRYVI